MAKKYGNFFNPAPSSLSDLQNDNNFLAIKEFTLNSSTLKGNTSYAITGLTPGSIITKISLIVNTVFASSSSTKTIELKTDANQVLFSKDWNDPTIKAAYSTDCYYVYSGNTNEIVVNHNLNAMTAGSAVLRFELYEALPSYTTAATSDGATYMTADQTAVEVTT